MPFTLLSFGAMSYKTIEIIESFKLRFKVLLTYAAAITPMTIHLPIFEYLFAFAKITVHQTSHDLVKLNLTLASLPSLP